MSRAKTPGRAATTLIVAVLTLFVGVVTWAVVDDYLLRDNLPAGARVAGVAVGGLLPADAARVIEQQVTGPLLAPLSVTFRDQRAEVEPAMFASADMDSLLAEAGAPKRASTLPQRIWWRVTATPYGTDTIKGIKVDPKKVRDWVTLEKKLVSVPAIDATVSVKGSRLIIKPAQAGISFDTTAATAALSDALLAGAKTVGFAETTTSPKVTNGKLGKTIFVSRSKKTLVLYNGTKIEKSYRCAVGMPRYPTPLGWWKIVAKQVNPTWRNNGADGAASLPDSIPGGPFGPLGTRALYLNASGIRIHGIPPSENWSIGNAASHGCMRMHRWDVEDLYPRVPVGTRVIIVA